MTDGLTMRYLLHADEDVLGAVTLRPGEPPTPESSPEWPGRFARAWSGVLANADKTGDVAAYLDHFAAPQRRGRGFWAERVPDDAPPPWDPAAAPRPHVSWPDLIPGDESPAEAPAPADAPLRHTRGKGPQRYAEAGPLAAGGAAAPPPPAPHESAEAVAGKLLSAPSREAGHLHAPFFNALRRHPSDVPTHPSVADALATIRPTHLPDDILESHHFDALTDDPRFEDHHLERRLRPVRDDVRGGRWLDAEQAKLAWEHGVLQNVARHHPGGHVSRLLQHHRNVLTNDEGTGLWAEKPGGHWDYHDAQDADDFASLLDHLGQEYYRGDEVHRHYPHSSQHGVVRVSDGGEFAYLPKDEWERHLDGLSGRFWPSREAMDEDVWDVPFETHGGRLTRVYRGEEDETETPGHLAEHGITLTRDRPDEVTASFEADGVPFVFDADLRQHDGEEGFEIQFARVGEDGSRQFGLMPAGEERPGQAMKVFSQMTRLTLHLLRDRRPRHFGFFARDGEASRVRLYDRFARGLAEQTGYTLHRVPAKDSVNYVFRWPHPGDPEPPPSVRWRGEEYRRRQEDLHKGPKSGRP